MKMEKNILWGGGLLAFYITKYEGNLIKLFLNGYILSSISVCRNVHRLFVGCYDCSLKNFVHWHLQDGITTEDYGKTKSHPLHAATKKYISRLIFIEMSIDALFCWWHQRVECHIFCRWDWTPSRGLVANTIEECKHSEGHERPINGPSLGLINYPMKETEVWEHHRNLIRTRFITQSLYHHPTPLTVFF